MTAPLSHDDLARQLQRDAERVPAPEPAAMAARVLSRLPPRLPAGASDAAARPALTWPRRVALPLGLAAALLLAWMVLPEPDATPPDAAAPGASATAPGSSAPGVPAASAQAPVASGAPARAAASVVTPRPTWVQVELPAPAPRSLPAVDHGPRPMTPVLARFLPSGPVDPLLTMERSVASQVDAAMQRAGAEALAVLHAAAAPLMRMGNALTSVGQPH